MADWSEGEAVAFGDALRRLRDSRGASQEWLADQLGVTRALVGQWENGVEPPWRQVFAIEECFGLRPGMLSRIIGYLPLKAKAVKSTQEAIEADPTLSDQGRRILRAAYQAARG